MQSHFESVSEHCHLTRSAHLPFDRTFGPEYGEYLCKNSLAEGHRKWAAKYGIVSVHNQERTGNSNANPEF